MQPYHVIPLLSCVMPSLRRGHNKLIITVPSIRDLSGNTVPGGDWIRLTLLVRKGSCQSFVGQLDIRTILRPAECITPRFCGNLFERSVDTSKSFCDVKVCTVLTAGKGMQCRSLVTLGNVTSTAGCPARQVNPQVS
jgi:hypothetical protein